MHAFCMFYLYVSLGIVDVLMINLSDRRVRKKSFSMIVKLGQDGI